MTIPTPQPPFQVVTGAFGYSGRYIAGRLLAMGARVRTLTNSTGRQNPFGERVEAFPFHFDQPDLLTASLEGADVLYNTYWVRFDYGDFNHSQAVKNTLALFEAARKAGVRRVVHVSITNPSIDSPLLYFRGKAELEQALIGSGLSYAILRPAVLFGREDILINNIAWALRHLPAFGVFGDGQYSLQPIHVEDFANLAVEQGGETGDCIIDAIGPETFTYLDLVITLLSILGVHHPLLMLPPSLGYTAAWAIGKMMGDILLTRDEIRGLMDNLLTTDSPPAGKTRLTDWAREHREALGKTYASELARRKDRQKAYIAL
jgi:nucleoside-diphosphate-sugar epimerase